MEYADTGSSNRGLLPSLIRLREQSNDSDVMNPNEISHSPIGSTGTPPIFVAVTPRSDSPQSTSMSGIYSSLETYELTV